MNYFNLEGFEKKLKKCDEMCEYDNPNIKYLFIINSSYVDEISDGTLIHLYNSIEDYLTEEEIEEKWPVRREVCDYFTATKDKRKGRRAM